MTIKNQKGKVTKMKRRKLSSVLAVLAAVSVLSSCTSISETPPARISDSTQIASFDITAVSSDESSDTYSESETDRTEPLQTEFLQTEPPISVTVSESAESESSEFLAKFTENASVLTETMTETTTEMTEETKRPWSETRTSGTMYVITDCVGREAASGDSTVITKFEKGEAVEISALTDSGFYKIKGGGYVHSEYLSDSPATDTETKTETEITTSYETSSEETTSTAAEPKPSGSENKPSSSKYKDRYAYNQLNENEKTLYKSIVKAVENFEPSAEVPEGMTNLDAFKVFIIVFNEEPQLFWMDSNFTMINGNLLPIRYKASKEEIGAMQEKIDANVSPLMAKINKASSDYDKLKLMYDYVVLHNDFSLDSSGFNPTIYNAFTDNGELQCAGYAKAIQYLCDLAGMESTVIVGKNSSDESHAWNVVKCGGKYYNLDATWGDPMNPSSGSIKYKKNYIRYTYFLVPDSIIHNISHCSVNQYTTSMGTVTCFTPPSCKSETYNYFKQAGLYYSDESSAEKAIKAQIKKAVTAKKQAVQIRVSSEELFNTVMADKLILEYQKYAKSLSSDVSGILFYRSETYKKTGIVTIDIVYK